MSVWLSIVGSGLAAGAWTAHETTKASIATSTEGSKRSNAGFILAMASCIFSRLSFLLIVYPVQILLGKREIHSHLNTHAQVSTLKSMASVTTPPLLSDTVTVTANSPALEGAVHVATEPVSEISPPVADHS